MAVEQDVAVGLYDLMGRRVRTLHQGRLEADRVHRFEIDGSRLPVGVYVVRIEGRTFQESRRLTVLR